MKVRFNILFKFIYFLLFFLFVNFLQNYYKIRFRVTKELRLQAETSDTQVLIKNRLSKYLQFECVEFDNCGGWGDRLKCILSSYAWSIITNRTFLIKSIEPYELSEILEPNEVRWDYTLSSYITSSELFSTKLLRIDWHYNFIEKFKSIDMINYLSEINLLRVRGGIMFVNAFPHNKFLLERIKSLGYDPANFTFHHQMHNWYNKLFKLSARLEKSYQTVLKKAKPHKNSKLICVQIRIGGSADKILDRKFAEKNDSKLFWDFLLKRFSKQLISNKFKIYLTTDKEYVKQEALSLFQPNKVIFMNDSSLHLDKNFQQKNEKFTVAENIILDFHMLQNCDAGIVSHSSFGILGLWNRKQPFKNLFVYTPMNQKDLKNNYEERKNLHFVQMKKPDDIYFL